MKKKDNFQPVIGLEVHIELKTNSKMFCSCSAEHFGHKPNTYVCPTCLGLPGALPVANKKAVDWTVITGMALDCKIPLFSKFDRKNYFYPDLPKGYQISQYDLPLAINGRLKIETRNRKFEVGIQRVHLEEDTAKMIHTKGMTLLDFNRAGVPLMEVVSAPDLRSAEEVQIYAKKLHQLIRYLDVSDCDMEKGQMRFELNISLKRKGEKLPQYKIEVKNINSFRFLDQSLKYEVKRQTALLIKGKTPLQETRGFNEAQGVTVSQRWKEEAQDYRYFPEPDLPPIKWSRKQIEVLKKCLPELPDQKITRFVEQFNILKSQAEILTRKREEGQYFEEAVRIGKKHGIAAGELAKVIINKKVNIEKFLPAELIQILVKKKVSPKISGQKLKSVIKKIIKENPKVVADYRQGKAQAVEFLVGQVMKKTKSAADPNQARKILLDALSVS